MINQVGLHQSAPVGNRRCDHQVVHRSNLRLSLTDGGLKPFPLVSPLSHDKRAFLVGKRKGQTAVKQKLAGKTVKLRQIQPQTHSRKSSVAGIGKGHPQILAAMGFSVVAADLILSLLHQAVAVKMKLAHAIRIFMKILQSRHNLKGRAWGVKSLGRAVYQLRLGVLR